MPSHGQRCSICSHPQRRGIEKKLRKGVSLELLAEQLGTTDDMLRMHREQHMIQATKTSVIQPTKMDAAHLYQEHDEVIAECRELIAFSRKLGDTKGWALGAREWRATLDQKNKILGLYDQVDPRLQRAFAAHMIEVVSRALENHPEAQREVLLAIEEVEGGEEK